MTPYELLVDILDKLRAEAPAAYKSYHPDPEETEKLNSARAKAFLHLFLKVRFGLLSFTEREEYITEGGYDGGIDAYYIDSERKTIYFLQAKFRTNEKNFEEKGIDPEELLMMDISRILEGETKSEAGIDYNQKTLRMAKRIREIKDIGRYNYMVVILANAKGITRQKLVLLTGGLPTELIDYKACYTKLLFPLITGTYYQAEQLQLSLSLSNKSAGAKISYTVNTEFTKCEITVIFVPTLEIAKAMFKYRNSILQYNPRSYLGHEGKNVNNEIRRSIEERATNEFALFNNGLTVLSDETYLNERIGQKDRAQLILVNPQIINGGQTAYTLSIIYRENLDKDVSHIFGEKEVLVKIITFEGGEGLHEEKKIQLIEDISRATNQQTTVTIADRRSNERGVKELQRKLFDRTGLFIERKRGEFEDGIREGYIKPSEIIDRTLIFRAAWITQGRLSEAKQRKLVAKANYDDLMNVSEETIDRYAFATQLLNKVIHRDPERTARITLNLLARVYLGVTIGFKPELTLREREREADRIAVALDGIWDEFKRFAKETFPTLESVKRASKKLERNIELYMNSPTFLSDVRNFIAESRPPTEPPLR
jgi:AIPR protein